MPFCPRLPYWMVRKDDPAIRFPASCNRYRCPVCSHKKVYERVRLMAWGAAQAQWATFVTWTLLPEDWQQARAQMRDWVRRMRLHNRLEVAWSREPNPAGTGYHAHGLQWGDYLQHEEMQRLWGGRHVWVEKLKGDAAKYSTKAMRVAGYSNKNGQMHLDINGGRAVHMSRGYLHGWRSRDVNRYFFKGHEWVLKIATEWERHVQDLTTIDTSTKIDGAGPAVSDKLTDAAAMDQFRAC